jgi:hypothetical protein
VPRDWRTGWTDNRHPKIKSMMQKYLKYTHGQIHLAEIFTAAAKTQTDLPTLPKYVHSTGRPFLCWASVLGKCGFRDCRFCKEGGHPFPGDITEELADQVINIIGKGVIPSASKGVPLLKSIKGKELNTDSIFPQNGAKGSGAQGWSSFIMGINCNLGVSKQKMEALGARHRSSGH